MNSENRLYPKQLQLQNFRNFRDATVSLGKKVTVISGKNGVGKSNILSLIASGSGVNKKSIMGSNFQPEFYDFFNIDEDEEYEEYKIYLSYAEDNNAVALTKRLSFKDDSGTNRGIRIIPRASNVGVENCTVQQAKKMAKEKYSVGGDARVGIPTIYLSLSRLYPLGEKKESVTIKTLNKNNSLFKNNAIEKYKEWYNFIIPNSIKHDAKVSSVEKSTTSRNSLHMDIENTPVLSQSIGQDNVGNIVSALVDIYVLSLENDYSGSLLCIDEVDVSLHPDTQIRILDLFNKLADELSIQFVVSTHSLTVLKEMVKKEEKDSLNYKVVYIKNPIAPYISENRSYELIVADMFGSFQHVKPKVKIYFEDCIGKELFEMLIKSFKVIQNKIGIDIETPVLRNSSNVNDFKEMNDRIKNLTFVQNIENNVAYIPLELGCDELMKISKADTYFKRVIFMLDGDARYKGSDKNPEIRDYLEGKYNPKEFGLNDIAHEKTICFLPDYFAPESYLYAIVYKLCDKALENLEFWRTLDSNENTAVYTADKIKELFDKLNPDFGNNDLKKIIKNKESSVAWKFIKCSEIVQYYYSDYETIEELLTFIEEVRDAYRIAEPLTLSNRYS